MSDGKRFQTIMILAGVIVIILIVINAWIKSNKNKPVKYSSKDEEEAEDAVDSLLNTLGIKKQSDLTDIDED